MQVAKPRGDSGNPHAHPHASGGPCAENAVVAPSTHKHALTHVTNALLLARTLSAHVGTLTSLHVSRGGLCADVLGSLEAALCACNHIHKLRISSDPLLMHADALAAFAQVLRGMHALQNLEWDTHSCMQLAAPMQPSAPLSGPAAAKLSAALSAASGLTKLTLSGPSVHATARISLPNLQTLEILCSHPAAPSQHIPRPSSAVHAQLVNPPAPQPPPLPPMMDCPMLATLSTATAAGDVAAAAATFAAVQQLPTLQRLECACSRLLQTSAISRMHAALSSLPALTSLQELSVSAEPKPAEASDAPAAWRPFLAALGQCAGLQRLYLRIKHDVDVAALGDTLGKLKSLWSLKVFDEGAGEDGSPCIAAALVAGLPTMSQLETLTLSVMIRVTGADALCCALGKVESLTRLSLDFAVFEEPGAAALLLARALGTLPALREVCVNADDLEGSWAAVVQGCCGGQG
eukprot:jgi/Ulvmu1/883/UM100_0038.1